MINSARTAVTQKTSTRKAILKCYYLNVMEDEMEVMWIEKEVAGGEGGAMKEEGLLGEVFRDMGEEDE
jgi:hypothetical protein